MFLTILMNFTLTLSPPIPGNPEYGNTVIFIIQNLKIVFFCYTSNHIVATFTSSHISNITTLTGSPLPNFFYDKCIASLKTGSWTDGTCVLAKLKGEPSYLWQICHIMVQISHNFETIPGKIQQPWSQRCLGFMSANSAGSC